MAELNIKQATVSNISNTITDYSVDRLGTDGTSEQTETTYTFPNWTKWFGYYKKIPELKKAIDALSTWTVGKGYDADDETKVILDNITGWGEDTFNSIMWNMFVIKKVNGDAFAEIIRDSETGELINLKPLDPGSMTVVVDKKGIIIRYEQRNKTGEKKLVKTFQPKEILHLCNDRVADEIHGVSVIEVCEDTILARNEALSDWKTILHRNINPLKIVELDTDDETKINNFITKWQNTVKDKEVLFIPKGNVTVTIPPVVLQDPLPTIKYHENFFYQTVGVPKVILGGSEEFTEASSKISYLTFEQVYKREQKEIEMDLWNQVFLRVTFKAPASLNNELLSSEEKQPNYGVGIQESEMIPGENE